jgi:hypothetical protein
VEVEPGYRNELPGASRGRTACVKLVAFVALVLFGCSSNGAAPGAPEAGAGPKAHAAAGAPEGAAGPKAYEEILGYDWSVAPGSETYFCVYKTISTDLWISDFRPLSPVGTHHVTLGFQDPGPPDGVMASTDNPAIPPCNRVTLGTNFLYFAGVGTGEMVLPDGVATRVTAGKQLVLSLHLLNTTATPLRGHSGVEIVRADPAGVVHQAEAIAAGKFKGLTVPPGPSTQTGTCTMQGDVTLFAVAPHMHLMGTHLTSTVALAGGRTTTLFDRDYQFEQQSYSFLNPPVALQKGDQMHVACTYDNTGTTTLTFGESTNQNEMCFLFTYRYPAIANSRVCAQ